MVQGGQNGEYRCEYGGNAAGGWSTLCVRASSHRQLEEAPSLQRLRRRAGVHEVVLDQCMFGLTSKDQDGVGLAKKPTRLLTSSVTVRDRLQIRCDKGQGSSTRAAHQRETGGGARVSAGHV